jgi:hypothetical protein
MVSIERTEGNNNEAFPALVGVGTNAINDKGRIHHHGYNTLDPDDDERSASGRDSYVGREPSAYPSPHGRAPASADMQNTLPARAEWHVSRSARAISNRIGRGWSRDRPPSTELAWSSAIVSGCIDV